MIFQLYVTHYFPEIRCIWEILYVHNDSSRVLVLPETPFMSLYLPRIPGYQGYPFFSVELISRSLDLLRCEYFRLPLYSSDYRLFLSPYTRRPGLPRTKLDLRVGSSRRKSESEGLRFYFHNLGGSFEDTLVYMFHGPRPQGLRGRTCDTPTRVNASSTWFGARRLPEMYLSSPGP